MSNIEYSSTSKVEEITTASVDITSEQYDNSSTEKQSISKPETSEDFPMNPPEDIPVIN